MLIGVVFSYHARGLIGNRRLWIAVPALFALFVICWPLTFFRWEFPSATLNYGYALVVFCAGYALRDAIKPSRVFDFFAAISYPLYLVHFLIGFSLMQILTSWNVNGLLATFAALAVTIALAAVLHRAIELPSQALGKALSIRAFPRTE
jgi:peptidoglycan/LPS O-acetylase OafA/YrhL